MAGISYYISVDLGAESGRVMLGAVSCEGIGLEEVYRFSNGPVEENGTLRWDFAGLFAEIKVGIARAIRQCDGEIAGIAVDSWGVDFGLIDEDGDLLEKPYHYRDGRTNGMMEKAFELMSKREIYEKTGLQFLQFNTVYQLLSMRLAGSEVLRRADKLIFMADLVSYYLSGEVFAEYTLGSTSQLMDMATGKWSKAVFDALFLPKGIMPKIVQPGSIVGSLQVELADASGHVLPGFDQTACTLTPVEDVRPQGMGRNAGQPSVDNLRSQVTWGDAVPASVPRDEPVVLRFTLQGTRLFSFQISA